MESQLNNPHSARREPLGRTAIRPSRASGPNGNPPVESLWAERQLRAFTLVELLVVIAIISLLASILVPSLRRGLTSAKEVQCAANLRSIGLAMHCYAVDNNGYAPCYASVYNLLGETVEDRWKRGALVHNAPNSELNSAHGIAKFLLEPGYLGEKNAMCCPLEDKYPGGFPTADWWFSFHDFSYYRSGTGPGGYHNWLKSCYFVRVLPLPYNSATADEPAENYPYRIGTNPGYPMAVDECYNTNDFEYEHYWNHYPNGGWNVLYEDGSVENFPDALDNIVLGGLNTYGTVLPSVMYRFRRNGGSFYE